MIISTKPFNTSLKFFQTVMEFEPTALMRLKECKLLKEKNHIHSHKVSSTLQVVQQPGHVHWVLSLSHGLAQAEIASVNYLHA